MNNACRQPCSCDHLSTLVRSRRSRVQSATSVTSLLMTNGAAYRGASASSARLTNSVVGNVDIVEKVGERGSRRVTGPEQRSTSNGASPSVTPFLSLRSSPLLLPANDGCRISGLLARLGATASASLGPVPLPSVVHALTFPLAKVGTDSTQQLTRWPAAGVAHIRVNSESRD